MTLHIPTTWRERLNGRTFRVFASRGKRGSGNVLELRMLSRPRVTFDGEVVTDFVSDKALALLCYLALNEGPQPRQALAGLLWGESSQKRARANLRVALHNVKQLVPGYLEVTRKQVSFDHDSPHWIDAVAFEKAAAFENAVVSTDAGETAHAEKTAAAIALYEEPFLNGLQAGGASEMETWLQAERERLRLLLVQMLERLGEQQAAQQRWGEATSTMRRLLALEPWRERTHRRLMLLLARQGEYAAALAQYEQCRVTIAAELDVAPMPETVALYERIRELRTRPRHNLPPAPSPFIGREDALQTLRRRLTGPDCRLLTLYGPGGIGKTWLALALARRVRPHFLDGVFYVPLSDLEAARHVPLAAGEAMGLSFAGPRPAAEQLLEQITGRELLLIFDNVEQSQSGAAFFYRLLTETEGVRVLAVSRVLLNLHQEWRVEVSGLALPTPDGRTVETAPAGQLFLQQVRRQRHELALDGREREAIARICHLVEGFPLALEQAASWLRVLTCAQLAHELEQGLLPLARGRTSVHRQSMTAVLEQSWRLLEEEEQGVFRRLCVFRGGFTHDAAAQVAGASIQMLAALVDHSLIRFEEEEGRYQIHELLRQFGAEKLAGDEGEDAAVRSRHATYYARFVTAQNHTAFSADEGQNLRLMQQKFENVWAAWQHVLSRRQPELVENFLQSFWYFYELQGLYREGLDTFFGAKEALAPEKDAGTKEERRVQGIALAYYGWFQMRTGAYQSALKWLEQGVTQLRRCCLETLPGWPIFCLGFALQLLGEYERSERLIRESVALHRSHRDESGLLHSESTLAFLWLSTGDVARAQAQIEKVISSWEYRSGRRMLSNLHFVRGLCALALGDPDGAEAWLNEGLAISRRGGDRWNEALSTHFLGLVARAHGDFAAARAQHRQALALMEKLHEKLGITFCLLGLGWAEQGLGNLEASRDHFERALDVAADIRVPPQILEALDGIAACLLLQGETARARELLALVAAHPATAHPVRQQAEMLLESSGGVPDLAQVTADVHALAQAVASYH